jgi:O-antigen ligase
VLTEVIGFIASSYRDNSFSALVYCSVLAAFYLLIRLNLTTEFQLVCIAGFISLMAEYLALKAGFTFLHSLRFMSNLGIDQINDVKQLLPSLYPVHNLPKGEAASIFLILLAFPLLLLTKFPKLKWLLFFPVFCLACTALLTFSRGLYLSVLVFAVLVCISFRINRLFKWMDLIAVNGLVLLLILTFMMFLPIAKPVATTLMLLQTTSQVRSLEGRLSAWKTAVSIAKKHPAFGVGSNNFAIHAAGFEPHGTPYTGRPFNLYLQILAEKGVVGLLPYLFFTAVFYALAVRTLKLPAVSPFYRSAVILAVASFSALLIRDVSYSSIMNNRALALLLSFMIGYTAQIRGMITE